MTKPMGYGLLAILACALLMGCGGGGGEPTVTQTVHDELQAELQAEIDAALAALAAEKAARDSAESAVARLTTQLATAEASVADLTDQLATSTGNVTDLTAQLATAEANALRLTGELETATANVTRLTAEIGSATDPASATGSLHAQLNAANAEVMRLEDLIGATTDTANAAGSLHAQLNAANAEVARLTTALSTAQTELTTARGRVTELETLVGDATNPSATSLRGRLAAEKARADQLAIDLAAARAEVAVLTGNLEDAEAEAEAERQRAAQAEADAQAQAQAEIAAQAQTAEARQRAQYMQAAMVLAFSDTAPPLGTDITMDTPSRGRLEIRRPGTSWRMATLGGSGLRNTTMALTSSVNTGKTVVYTNRELSRPLLEHFGHLRDPNNRNLLAFTTGELIFSIVNADGESTDGEVDTSSGSTMDMWKLTHRIPKTVARDLRVNAQGQPVNLSDVVVTDRADYVYEVNTEREGPKMAKSYPLSLFGIGGALVAAGGGDVTVTPVFAVDPNNAARSVLQTVTVSGTNLRFDPSGSPSVHFYNGADFLGDYEYMVFGYWREDPISPASPYDNGAIGVFAQVFEGVGSLAEPSTINATYRGTGVGMYVEQELSDAIDTHRQGEFVANAILTVNGGPDTITGTIRDFAVTPTAGSAMPDRHERWVVRLGHDGTSKTITLNNESGGTMGGWTHDYVKAHEYAGRDSAESDDDRSIPTGVTGTFNARIGDIGRTGQHTDTIDTAALHIIGAFGAER